MEIIFINLFNENLTDNLASDIYKSHKFRNQRFDCKIKTNKEKQTLEKMIICKSLQTNAILFRVWKSLDIKM